MISKTISTLPDAIVSTDITNVLHRCDQQKPVFVIGGERMFIQALAYAQKIIMTIVPGDYECDKFFPLAQLNRGFSIDAAEKLDGDNDLRVVTYIRDKHFR